MIEMPKAPRVLPGWVAEGKREECRERAERYGNFPRRLRGQWLRRGMPRRRVTASAFLVRSRSLQRTESTVSYEWRRT